MDGYVKCGKLGKGSYGIVFKAKNKKDRKFYAIKKIRKDSEDEGIPSTTIREISLLKELVHPNIVGLEDVLIEKSRIYLIFEFVELDLKKLLDKQKGEFLKKEVVKSYTYQILQAILFCHKRRIMHRDLKPQNILVTSEGLIKVADFGLGRTFGIPVRIYTHEVVTLWYRAPEVLLGSMRYACPLDVWSVACIFAELATKQPLFQGDSEIDQLFKIFRILKTPSDDIWPDISSLQEFTPSFPKWTDDRLEASLNGRIKKNGIDLLRKMLIYNPKERITAEDALCHEFFEDVHECNQNLPNYEPFEL